MPSNSGSASLKLAIGGTSPVLRQRTAIASSNPAPMEWPVKPLVLLTITLLTSLPKVDLSAYASALAEPPRAGV